MGKPHLQMAKKPTKFLKNYVISLLIKNQTMLIETVTRNALQESCSAQNLRENSYHGVVFVVRALTLTYSFTKKEVHVSCCAAIFEKFQNFIRTAFNRPPACG